MGHARGRQASPEASFAYTGAGARVRKTDASAARATKAVQGGAANTYRRDGLGVTSPILADGTATYTPGVSERRGGVSTFSHSGLKNMGAQTSALGAVTAKKRYDAFGAATDQTGTWQGPSGYGGGFGYQTDAEHGLMQLGHRYYDPDLGRFISPDPAMDGTNWWAYCDNNPVSRVDDQGLGWHDPVCVEVDKNFQGKVWVVGEPGPGKPQIFRPVPAGTSSPEGMDVDIVIVQSPDGSQRRYFLPGTNGPQDPRNFGSTYIVDANGRVKAVQRPWTLVGWLPGTVPGLKAPVFMPPLIPVLAPRPFGPNSGSYPGWLFGGTGDWNDDIEAAKRRG